MLAMVDFLRLLESALSAIKNSSLAAKAPLLVALFGSALKPVLPTFKPLVLPAPLILIPVASTSRLRFDAETAREFELLNNPLPILIFAADRFPPTLAASILNKLKPSP